MTQEITLVSPNVSACPKLGAILTPRLRPAKQGDTTNRIGRPFVPFFGPGLGTTLTSLLNKPVAVCPPSRSLRPSRLKFPPNFMGFMSQLPIKSAGHSALPAKSRSRIPCNSAIRHPRAKIPFFTVCTALYRISRVSLGTRSRLFRRNPLISHFPPQTSWSDVPFCPTHHCASA